MIPPRTAACVAGIAVALLASACGGKNPDAGTAAPETSTTSTTSTTAPPGPVSDQSRPPSAFGLTFHEGKLWVADFYGGQVLAVDPDSGAIVKRFKGEDGVPEEVTDVAVGPDGTVYWTGFNDGAIGRMSTANVNAVIGGVGPGASGIAMSPEGKLYAGRAITSDGLWEIDPNAEKKERKVADSIGNIKAFAVGPDGMIYGARYGTAGAGTLVRIDPTDHGDKTADRSGEKSDRDAKGDAPVEAPTTELATGFDSPVAVKLSPDGATAYVLSQPRGGKPKLQAVDLRTKAITDLPAPQTALVGGMAVGTDGRIFVSAYNEPVLTVIRPDGDVKRIGIGRA